MVKQLSDVYQISEVDGSSLGINGLIRLYTFVNFDNFDVDNLSPEMFKTESLSRIDSIMSDYFNQPFTLGDPRTGMNMPDGLWSILGSLIPQSLTPEIAPLVSGTRLIYDSEGFGTTSGDKKISYITLKSDGTVEQIIKETVTDVTSTGIRYIFMSIHDPSTEIQDINDLKNKLAAYYAAGSEEAAHALPTGDPKHWNTEKVPDYSGVFDGNVSDYHPTLDNWTMTQATNMQFMFANSNYNHDLNCLERTLPTPSTVGNMIRMDCLFCENRVFNNGEGQGESSNPLLWKTDSANLMMFMFGTNGSTPSIFNQRLGDDSEKYFNTSNAKNMQGMFRLCVDFNQSISHFKTGSVDNTEDFGFSGMKEMFFGATSFNNGGDMCIGDLDVSNVDTFENMFLGAVNFDQQINSWKVKETANLTNMTEGSGLFLNDTLNQGFKDVATPTVDLFGKESYCANVDVVVENAELRALITQINLKRTLLTSEHTVLKDLLVTVQEKNAAAAKYAVDKKITDDDKENDDYLVGKLQESWQISLIGQDRYFNDAYATKLRDQSSLYTTLRPKRGDCVSVTSLYMDADSFAHTAEQMVEGEFLNQRTEMTALLQGLRNTVSELDLSPSDETYMNAYIVSLEAELVEIHETFELEEAIHKIADTNIAKYKNLEVIYRDFVNVVRSYKVPSRNYPTKAELLRALDKWYEIANNSDVEIANSYIGPEYIGNPRFWDVANIDDMSSVFEKKTGTKHPDISLWNMTNVNNTAYMFNGSTFDNDIPLVKRKNEDITIRVTLEDIRPKWLKPSIEADGFQPQVADPEIVSQVVPLLVSGFGFPPDLARSVANDWARYFSIISDALKITNTTTNEVYNLTLGNDMSVEEFFGFPEGIDLGLGLPSNPNPPLKIVKEFTMNTKDILHIKTSDALNDDISFTIEEVVTDTIIKPRLYYGSSSTQAENLDLEIKMPSAWNTKNVTTMKGMFKGGTFNQDIGSWDVCNVRDFSEMFKDNEEFDNDGSDAIDSWFYKRC